MHVLTRRIVAICLTLLAFTGSVARAERPTAAQLLPDDTLAYLRIAHVPNMREKFLETALGKIANDPQVKPLVAQLYGSLTEAYARIQDEVGASLGELLDLPQGEVAIAAVKTSTRPAVIMLFEVGTQLPKVRALIERGEKALAGTGAVRTTENVEGLEVVVHQSPNNADQRLLWCEKEGVIVVSSQMEALKKLLARWNAPDNKDLGLPLTQNKKFASIMNRCGGSGGEAASLTWFVDPIATARHLARGNISAQTGVAILPALGLDGLQAVGGSLVFGVEDFDLVTHAHLLLETPRSGVLEMLALKTGDTSPENWVPADAASYTTIYWDVQKSYAELNKLVNSFVGENALAGRAKTASENIGADIEGELIPAIGGRFTTISWVGKSAKLNSRANAWAVQLKDAKAFTPVVEKMAAKFSDDIESKSYAGVKYWRTTKPVNPPRRPRNADNAGGDAPANDDIGNDARLVDEVHPCFAILGDYLFIADREALLERCLAAQNDSGAGLAKELDFKLIASKIKRQPGGDQAGMIMFDRPEEGLRQIYDLATADATRERLGRAAEDNDFFKAIDGAMKQNPLPPFAVLAKYLAPGGGMLTTDETGFHYTGFTLKRK